MGEGVSTNLKSSNRIELSQLIQVLLNFYDFRGSHLHEIIMSNMYTCVCMHATELSTIEKFEMYP